MALSGSFNTNSYSGRYYTLSWTASQSVASNQSTINWTISCAGDSGVWYAERTLVAVIAGTTVYSKTDRVERYSGTIATGTITLNHNTDGTKSFSASLQVAVYTSAVNCTGSGSFTLNTIARKSTLSVPNGTLGKSQTLTVAEQDGTFKHKLIYACGNASGYILGSSSSFSTSNSVSWEPPISLASQNTSGENVSVTFTLYTYTSGGTSIGSNSYTRTFAIPATVAPIATIEEPTDPEGWLEQFGKFIQGKSTVGVAIKAEGSYGSTIKSYKTTVDGKTYTNAEFTTDVLAGKDTLTITAVVTDSRGRSATATKEIDVYEYKVPKITSLNAKRCLQDGTINNSGAYLKAEFSNEVTSLDEQNTASVSINYKKKSDSNFKSVILGDFENTYLISAGNYIFEADKSSSYDIEIVVKDAFGTIRKRTTGPSEAVFSSKFRQGLGYALGKLAELEGVFDIGWKTRFSGGVLHLVLDELTDLNEILTPNIYAGRDVAIAGYSNCPADYTEGKFTLEVVSCGDNGELKQTFTTCSKDNPQVYVRFYYDGEWGAWVNRFAELNSKLLEIVPLKREAFFTSSTELSYTGVSITIPPKSFFSISVRAVWSYARPNAVMIGENTTSSYSDEAINMDRSAHVSTSLNGYTESGRTFYVWARYDAVSDKEYIGINGFFIRIKS